jgi:hypothetical protein
MKVFVSWSGEGSQSHALAEAFDNWLPSVLQTVQTFVSSAALEAGERWQSGLGKVLEECDFGIACLTPDSLHSDWILFECGALAKRVERARVIPVLCGLREPDMTRHPLTMFNYVKLDEPGVRKVVETINANATDHKLPKDKLDQVFEKWWPDFEAHINRIEETPGSVTKKVFDLEGSIEVMLSLMRSISRRTTLPDLQLPIDTDAASPTFTTLGDLKVSLPPFPNLRPRGFRALEASVERVRGSNGEVA